MGQIIRKEIVGLLQRSGTQSVTLAQSVLNIGGQQFATQSTLLMSLTTSGFGGLDTGSITASTTYHLYAVVNNAGAVGLVASLRLPIANGPVGFPNWKYLWSIHTDQSSLILEFQRVGKKNVFVDSLEGVKNNPDVTANNSALLIDSSGGSPWTVGTSASNNATFTNNMLSGLADEFEGIFFAVGDGGSSGFRARLFEGNPSPQGNIAAVGSYISGVGVLFEAHYTGVVGASYLIEMAVSPGLAERDLANKILSYDNKLVDESSSAGTIVNIGTLIPGPASEIWLTGDNGFGGSSSGDTAIRDFLTVRKIIGGDLTYFPRSATVADYIQVNTAGTYCITSSYNANAAYDMGISVNTTQTSTGILQIPAGENVASETNQANWPTTVSVTLNLNPGDKIRSHVGPSSTGGAEPTAFDLRVTKVANAPGLVLPGPRSQVVVDTNASLGSASGNQIVVWTNVQSITGSDISVTQDPVNGWYFTINTDGVYGMSTDVTQTGIAHTGISRNQSNLLTDITGIPATQRLTDNTSHSDNGASNHVPSATTRFLNAGDIIRVCAGTSIGGQANLTYFSIVKVSN